MFSRRAKRRTKVGFKVCDDYRNGEAAMAQMQAPILFILGRLDQMTLPKAAQ